jgi:hypothetical protein
MSRLKRSIWFLVAFSFILSFASIVQAKTESLSVPAERELVQTIILAAGDRIDVTFTALGQTSNILHFWVVFPNATKRDFGETSQFAFSFASDFKGECTLHFDNSGSSESKLITLNYEIENYIFGIPQIFFLIVVIAALLLIIVAGYIIMGKYG